MSAGPIARLSETDLIYIPEPPEFEALAAAELGAHGTDADGFPALFNETADLTVAGSHAFDGTDQDIADASNAAAAIAQPEGAQLAAEIEPAAAAADALLNDFTGNTGSAPGAPPPPPGPGAGEGCDIRIDIGTGQAPTVDLRTFADIPPADSIEMVDGDPAHWYGILTDSGDEQNSRPMIAISFSSNDPGAFSATWRLHLIDSDTPYTVCATITLE